MKYILMILCLFLFLSLSPANVCFAGNIALDYGVATASSVYFDPQNAIDGNPLTGWTSGSYGSISNPEWLVVDLQDLYQVSQIDLLYWQYGGSPYFGYTNEYNLYTSVNGIDWSSIGSGILAEHTDPEFYSDTFAVSGDPLRYVKYEVVGGTHWAGICEAEIYDVSPVPIPATCVLLLSGVIGLVEIKKKVC